MTPSQIAQLKLTEMPFMKKGREKTRRENDALAQGLVDEVQSRFINNNNNSSNNNNNSQQVGARMQFTSSQNVDANLTAATGQQQVVKQSGTRRQREEGEETSVSQEITTSATKPATSSSSSSSATLTKQSSSTIVATTSSSDSQQQQKNDRQDYLISRAFAQDDLDEDFDKKKGQQVEGIMKPDDPNASMPGWGEWGGNDAKLNQKHKERVAANELKKRMEKSTLLNARADAALDNVIINHDVDLVPSKYMLHMVPRPFANATEFQRSMRQPIGPEWTTPQSYKRQIAPKIQSKSGVAIDPVDNTTGISKKSKTAMKKKDVGSGKKKLSVQKQ